MSCCSCQRSGPGRTTGWLAKKSNKKEIKRKAKESPLSRHRGPLDAGLLGVPAQRLPAQRIRGLSQMLPSGEAKLASSILVCPAYSPRLTSHLFPSWIHMPIGQTYYVHEASGKRSFSLPGSQTRQDKESVHLQGQGQGQGQDESKGSSSRDR